jgi:hypothetical protein
MTIPWTNLGNQQNSVGFDYDPIAGQKEGGGGGGGGGCARKGQLLCEWNTMSS